MVGRRQRSALHERCCYEDAVKNPYDDLKTMAPADIRKGLGMQAILFVVLGGGLWVVSGRELSRFVTVSFTEIGLGFALGLVLISFAAAVFYGFPGLSEKLVRLQARNLAFLEKRLSMPMIAFISLCAGVGEEALFRGGLQTFLSDYLPIAVAIGVSSFLFMVIHFAKPLIAALIFIIGCFFGVAYWWTGSLLAVMIGHAVYDVYALWFLQKEMPRLSVFEQNDDADSAITAES